MLDERIAGDCYIIWVCYRADPVHSIKQPVRHSFLCGRFPRGSKGHRRLFVLLAWRNERDILAATRFDSSLPVGSREVEPRDKCLRLQAKARSPGVCVASDRAGLNPPAVHSQTVFSSVPASQHYYPRPLWVPSRP